MSFVLVRLFKTSLVITGIIVLTSFSVDATDYFRGSQSALAILADKATASTCREEMVEIAMNEGTYICIDRYEASPGPRCDYRTPNRIEETALNINTKACVPVSVKGSVPWTNVAKAQAEQLCAKVGKRLPGNAEWYAAALGTPDGRNACNTASGALRTSGSQTDCTSGRGVFDMVGNVWEWVAGEVNQGAVDGRELPLEGYVAGVDENGIPRVTTTTPQVVFNQDYVWSDFSGSRVMMRGGFYGSRNDAGIYTLQANGSQTFAGAAVGFRCAETR